jgi:hypothetical protein
MFTSEIDEIIEISEILLNFSFYYYSFSKFILENCLDFLQYMDKYISNSKNFNRENFIIFFNFIFILSNCLSDNLNKNWNLEQVFFSCININTIFELFEDYFSLPVYGRHFIIWIVNNILKLTKEKENFSNANNIQFNSVNSGLNHESNFHENFKFAVLNFINKENTNKIYTKIFNISGLINESTKEIMKFFYVLMEQKNFDFQNGTNNCKFMEVFEQIFTGTKNFAILKSTFILINKIFYFDFSLKEKTLNKYHILKLLPNLVYIILSEVKNHYIDSGFYSEIVIKPSLEKQGKLKINLVDLLDEVLLFCNIFCESSPLIFGEKLMEEENLMKNLTEIFYLISKNGISNYLLGSTESYLIIIESLLSNEKCTNNFIGLISDNVLELLAEILIATKEKKDLLLLVLKSFDHFLNMADEFIKDNIGNIIAKKMEGLGCSNEINILRDNKNDEIAELANEIYESYFNN